MHCLETDDYAAADAPPQFAEHSAQNDRLKNLAELFLSPYGQNIHAEPPEKKRKNSGISNAVHEYELK